MGQAPGGAAVPTIGVGMLGYAFMGKARADRYKTLRYMAWPPAPSEGTTGELEHLLVAIGGRNAVAPDGATFEDGYRAAEICDAIIRSASDGRRVTNEYRSAVARTLLVQARRAALACR
jgi:hypothetical protein